MFGGRGGIRTHGRLSPTPVFKTGALNRSATLPLAVRLFSSFAGSVNVCRAARHPPAAKAADPATNHQPAHLHLVHTNDNTIEFPAVQVHDEGQDDDGRNDDGQDGEKNKFAAAAAVGGAAAWMREAFAPGSGLYADRQPSIAEVVRRAKHGGQLATHGPLRHIAKAHGYVAAANKAVCDTWVWIVNHPARLVVALGLLGLAVAFPTTRHLISLLLAPFTWARQALDPGLD